MWTLTYSLRGSLQAYEQRLKVSVAASVSRFAAKNGKARAEQMRNDRGRLGTCVQSMYAWGYLKCAEGRCRAEGQ